MKKEAVLSVSEFKARCLRLVDEVAASGAGIILTKRGRPVVRVSPLEPPRATLRESWKGIVKGKSDLVRLDLAPEWDRSR